MESPNNTNLPYSMIAMVENFFFLSHAIFQIMQLRMLVFVYTPFAEYFGIIQRLGSGGGDRRRHGIKMGKIFPNFLQWFN